MNLFRRRVAGAPDGRERRHARNAELRQSFDDEKKFQLQQTLKAAQVETAANADRIERLRKIARVVQMK